MSADPACITALNDTEQARLHAAQDVVENCMQSSADLALNMGTHLGSGCAWMAKHGEHVRLGFALAHVIASAIVFAGDTIAAAIRDSKGGAT